MRFMKVTLAVAALALALTATPALSKKDKGVPPGHANAAKFYADAPYAPGAKKKFVGFSQGDGAVIRGYFAGQPMPWAALPPGIAKNYARGKPLPPGIAKKVLPPALLAQLPPRPGHYYAQVGSDVVLIEAATKLVVDIIVDVLN